MPTISYGNYPERLSDLLGSLGEAERDRARILTKEENDELESISLNRLPQTSWGTIDWNSINVREQHAVSDDVEGAALLRQLVLRYAEADSETIIFWGNLVVPSLALAVSIVAELTNEILATSHDVWLFAVKEQIILEYFHEGRLTVADVPTY